MAPRDHLDPDALVCRQVEFGAHQVILVRTQDSVHELPDELKESNAIIMTVPQAKGLEFDDVFLVRHLPCGHRIPRSNLHSHGRLVSVSVCLVLRVWCDEHCSCTSVLAAS